MKSTFKNRTVLVTGHTGFKGSWLSLWLHTLGAKVIGISDRIVSKPSMFELNDIGRLVTDLRNDICDTQNLRSIIEYFKPDFIFHLAAQSIVTEAYSNPLGTMMSNAIGSAGLLDVLRGTRHRVNVVMITSDKVYKNNEWVWGYRENDEIGGFDPYSASKGMAELAISSYVHSFLGDGACQVRVAVARAGNVIGGGDWAPNRIVPDCVRAWCSDNVVEIRSPESTRPWQFVLEPLSGYLKLACELSEGTLNQGESFNFGPPSNQNYSVRSLIERMQKGWPQAAWRDMSEIKPSVNKESTLLKLNCDKAEIKIGWKPKLSFEETADLTIDWYRKHYHGTKEKMFDVSLDQIRSFEERVN